MLQISAAKRHYQVTVYKEKEMITLPCCATKQLRSQLHIVLGVNLYPGFFSLPERGYSFYYI
jgi:hypothetical protein